MTDSASQATQLQPQGAQPTAGQPTTLQSIDAFVEQHAKLPCGAYKLPRWTDPEEGLESQGLMMVLKSGEDDNAEHPMFTALKPPSTLPMALLTDSKEHAVETWTLARKEFEERLSALTPGEQLYFTTAFISDETGYGHGFGPLYGCAMPVRPSLLLQCLIGEGSTPLAALKKWIADHPAEGTVEMYNGERRSPLFALLACTISIMEMCAADGYACG